MSVWKVGNMGWPPKAYSMVPNAEPKDRGLTLLWWTGSARSESSPITITRMMQAVVVAIMAPTPMYLKQIGHCGVSRIIFTGYVRSVCHTVHIKRETAITF